MGESPTYFDIDDLLSPLSIDDPTTYFARLRETDPVHWNPRWKGWVVTGYDDVLQGFRDHTRLSSDRFAGPFGENLRSGGAAYAELTSFLSKFFVWKDQPYHSRVRELVAGLIASYVDGEEIDFLAQFAFGLPLVIIADYLGVPASGRERMRSWSEDLGAVIFVSGRDEDRLRKGNQAMTELVEMLRPVVRARRETPEDDLLSGMVQAEERGEVLSEDEIIANAILMVFAGHETTMNLLANGMVAFASFPEEWTRLRRDPSLAATTTEEILRYDGPIRAMARWAREPLQLGQRTIAQGDRVLLVQHAANHDPAQFTDPERLDITRSPNRHVAFGQGIHTCLGAPLSRMEAQEAFAALATAFPRFDVREKEHRYAPTVVSRSLQQLHLTLHRK